MIETVWRTFPVIEQIHISDLFSLFRIHYDSGYEFPGEIHNFWECLYVINGEVCVSADERVYNLTAGQIIFHKPMELHKFLVISPEGADVLTFSFLAEGPLTDLLRDKVFVLSRTQQMMIDNMLTYIQAQEVETGIEKKEHLYLKGYEQMPNYLQMVVTYLYQVFLTLNESAAASQSHARDAIVFRKAVSYMNSKLQEQPTISDIARYCYVSEASLKRIFDKYAGMGVHKYFLKLKIKTAMELLQNGESVSCAAERTGFSSQSYFSKAFKRETGIIPSDF